MEDSIRFVKRKEEPVKRYLREWCYLKEEVDVIVKQLMDSLTRQQSDFELLLYDDPASVKVKEIITVGTPGINATDMLNKIILGSAIVQSGIQISSADEFVEKMKAMHDLQEKIIHELSED